MAESLKGSAGSADGMQELVALLGIDEWPLGSGSAEAELAKAHASIFGPPAPEGIEAGQPLMSSGLTSAQPKAQGDATKAVKAAAAEAEGEERSTSAQDRSELMQGLTAEIAAAAQKAAQDAISSSVQVSIFLLCCCLKCET